MEANLGNQGLDFWGAAEDTKAWELCSSGRVGRLPVMALLCVRKQCISQTSAGGREQHTSGC